MTKRITEPRKRTRTVQIKFWTTPEEKELIEKKMALTGIVHLGAYLRKMAIDGYVVNLQIPELKDILRCLRYANTSDVPEGASNTENTVLIGQSA